MKTSEAVRLIAMLAAAFRQEVSEETAALWANEVSKSEVVDVVEAVQIAMTSGRFMPSLAEFMDLIRDCRNVRLTKAQEDRESLPEPQSSEPHCEGCADTYVPGEPYPFSQFLRDHPDQAAKVKALSAPKVKGNPIAATLTQLLLDEGVKP